MSLRPLGVALGLVTRSFEAALADPAAAQARVAQRIHADLVGTELGRRHGLTAGAPPLVGLPAQTWDELAPFAAVQVAGRRGVSHSPLAFVERTSGSSGPRKDIPWTTASRRTLSWMFLVWMADLLRRGPPLGSGRAWLAATPPLAVPGAGEPHGAPDDTAYLSPWLAPLLRPFLVEAPRLPAGTDGPTWIAAVSAALARDPRLEVIGCWSPSLLVLLLQHLRAHSADLGLSTARARAARTGDWPALWPSLRLVSCWADADAARDAAWVADQLPGVLVQGKGLLATEGPMTVPWVRGPAPVPLVDTVLLELQTDQGVLVPLHEASLGATYEIVPSWPGGLVRYRLGDRVRVEGFVEATPCLRFVGRSGGVVDLVGEKLHPDVVSDALRALLPDRWATLAPVTRPRPGYVLLTEAPVDHATVDALDRRLRGAWHYGQARALGQLDALRAAHHPDVRAATLVFRAGGARLGDAKDGPLLPRAADELLARLRA